MGCRVSQLYSCGVYDSRQMWPILPHSAYGPLYPTYKFLEAIGSKPKVVAHSSVDPGRKTSPSSASDSTGRAGNNAVFSTLWDFPGGASGKEPTCQCRRCKRLGFNPWVRKIPWRRKWQPTPVFLPGESHGQRSPVGYSARGCKKIRHDWSNLTTHSILWRASLRSLEKGRSYYLPSCLATSSLCPFTTWGSEQTNG